MPKTRAEIQRDYEKRSKYASIRKYQSEKTTTVNVRIVRSTESDILAKLDSVPNKSGYIKSLIRKDIGSNPS